MVLLKMVRSMDLDICIIFRGDFLRDCLRMIRKLKGLRWMMLNCIWDSTIKTKEMARVY